RRTSPRGPLLPRQNMCVPMSTWKPCFSYPEQEPPSLRFFSTSVTGIPASARRSVAALPPIPDPTTTARMGGMYPRRMFRSEGAGVLRPKRAFVYLGVALLGLVPTALVIAIATGIYPLATLLIH